MRHILPQPAAGSGPGALRIGCDDSAVHTDWDLGLCGLDAVDLARLLADREVSAREVAEAFVAHAARVNPSVNALVTRTFDQALERAGRLDRALAAGTAAGLLHGLPVAHKDLADTAGVRTTYGSTVFADHVPDADDLHVARMTAAGAVSLGKTNTPEFGAGSQTFNRVFGATLNPYDLTRTSGGSSGGAAAALAVRAIALADGSDMGGSLRNPAAFCNVVGLRPSPGRVPDPGATDPWSPLAVVGPMARTVADVGLLLAAIAGPDPSCPLTATGDAGPFSSATEVLAELDAPIRAPRVAWSPDLGGLPVDPAIRAVLSALPDLLTGLGWPVTEATPDLAGADQAFGTLRAQLYATSFESLLAQHRDQLKDTVVGNIEQGLALTSADLRQAARASALLLHRAGRFWNDHDLLVCPVTQVPPFDVRTEWVREIDGQELGSYIEWMASATRVTMLAAPALSLPAGFTPAGLPVGVQLVAAPGRDWDLLRWARLLEAATGHARRLPPFTAYGPA
jgi:amidase